MENTSLLRPVSGTGWRMGFANLFHEASGSMWHTKKWIIQTLIWLLFLNGMLAAFLWQGSGGVASDTVADFESASSMGAVQEDQTLSSLVVYLVFSGMMLPVAAIIAGQDAIIGERQSGTAAWVLSKPVSREAFILSRLAANTLGILITGVVIQGVIAYTQLSLKVGSPWPISGYLGAMGLIFLNLFFYLSLTYMLGSICSTRGPILGIGLTAALIGPTLLRSMPVIKDFTPWAFFMPVSAEVPTGVAVAIGQPIASVTPIICTAMVSLIFIVVTVLRFQREEF